MTDKCGGPEQTLAKAIIVLEETLDGSGCPATIRWTPAHKGVGGRQNGRPLCQVGSRDPERRGGQAAPTRGKLRPTHPQDSRSQIPTHQGAGLEPREGQSRRYPPPLSPSWAVGFERTYRTNERRLRAGTTSSFQAMPPLAEKTSITQSNDSWWCGSGERQSHLYLFFWCQAWAAQSREMWRAPGRRAGGNIPGQLQSGDSSTTTERPPRCLPP